MLTFVGFRLEFTQLMIAFISSLYLNTFQMIGRLTSPILLFVICLQLTIPGTVYSQQVPEQELVPNIPYWNDGHPRHVLDVYRPTSSAKDGKRPVVVWIHGGGWQTGDKSDVAIKPRFFMDQGYVFVACNYRLLPDVTMDELIRDVAQSIAWVHKNIDMHEGDPERLIIGGHSAGAQLAALLCIDDRYLKEVGVPFSSLKGCIPVDGDTYDIPKIIMTAEHRQMIYGDKMPTFGHRQKFGNDPLKHVDFSAVTHISKDKGIPPFMILFFSGNPDTTAQARRLESVLSGSDIPVSVFGSYDTNHSLLNDNLGRPGDAATQSLIQFLQRI
jgi:arylformamidase